MPVFKGRVHLPLISRVSGLIIVLLLAVNPSMIQAHATIEPETPGERYIIQTFDTTRNDWWLVQTATNQVYCTVYADHVGLPEYNDVVSSCGKDIGALWQRVSENFYFQFIKSYRGMHPVKIPVSKPSINFSVSNCNPLPPENRCDEIPILKFKAGEFMPGQTITSITIARDSRTTTCKGDTCLFSLYETGSQGVGIEFWANSSYGDSSDHYRLQARVLPMGQQRYRDREQSRSYSVDILSDRWQDGRPGGCALIWNTYPPTGGSPAWLQTPDKAAKLASGLPYVYLAGNLISQGAVKAPDCPSGGLVQSGVANTCGVEAAQQALTEWQNSFDERILSVSNQTGVPASLIKKIFARESQLWPGMYKNFTEVGFGQLTENGADTILTWNTEFFYKFCPTVLNSDTCGLGIFNLNDNYRSMLRGALVNSANATCPNCKLGIDMNRANASINIFAQGLLANCNHTDHILTTLTGMPSSRTASYEDLWRMTLVNYNAGPGCLTSAITDVLQADLPISWQNVAAFLPVGCQESLRYISDITK
jgi:hypothetical protein